MESEHGPTMRPAHARPTRAVVIDDFAAYGASLAAALKRHGIAEVTRFDSHDAAIANRAELLDADILFVDVYRHAAERAADPHLSGLGAIDVVTAISSAPSRQERPRVVVYGSWASRPEIRLLMAELPAVEALYDSGELLTHIEHALAGDHHGALPDPGLVVRQEVGVGRAARLVDALTTARQLGAEEGEPFGEVWRLICELDLGRDARRAAGVPEAVRRAIGRRLVPLLDLPADATYLDAVRVIQRLAAVGPR